MIQNKKIKTLIMFTLGAALYTLVEIVYRNEAYRLSSLMGGIAFCFADWLNNRFSWRMDLLLQSFCVSSLVTFLEAFIGNIDYYFLHLNMWNYSSLPLSAFNGKVCLPFSVIWFFMAFIAIFLCDAIAYYWMHDGDQPRYYIFGKEIFRMPKRVCCKN